LAARLRPDLLTRLSAPADFFAVAGRRCRNKAEGKGGGRKARERREREAPHPRCF